MNSYAAFSIAQPLTLDHPHHLQHRHERQVNNRRRLRVPLKHHHLQPHQPCITKQQQTYTHNIIECKSSPSNKNNDKVKNLVIIGSGPAGYTAALYAGRANLRPLLLEGMQSGIIGGQLMTTAEVENFPGFPNGITGPKLMSEMKLQALRYDANMIADDCTSIDLDTFPYEIETNESGKILTYSVIIATGASAKKLNIKNEATFWGTGISACAVCDGAAPIFNNVDIAVVGGGDSACEEAVFMCKFAKQVHLLVRGSTLKASGALVDRVNRHPRVHVHFNTNVMEALGKDALVTMSSPTSSSPDDDDDDDVIITEHSNQTSINSNRRVVKRNSSINQSNEQGSPLHGLKLRDNVSGDERFLAVRGLFYAIGHKPNTDFIRGSSRLKFDARGYLKTGSNIHQPQTHHNSESLAYTNGLSPYTGQDGVFAAGDVADPCWRQAITAASTGTMAALAAEKYLSETGLLIEYHQSKEEEKVEQLKSLSDEESEEEQALEQRGTDDDESNYNVENTWHIGQFALRKLYHESTRPLIVKYRSPNCGPCQQLKPMLHAVIRNYEGKVHYVEIDITRDSEIAEAAGVSGSPTVQIFHERSLIKEFRGVKMKSDYRQVVESILGQQVSS